MAAEPPPHCLTPNPTRGTDGNHRETQAHVHDDNASQTGLVEGRLGPIFFGDGLAHTSVGLRIQEDEDADHQQPDPVHDIHMERGFLETAIIDVNDAVAGC